MTEVKDFSIEPYINGGGIMGNYLEVNQEAANHVMQGTDLSRDVQVIRETHNNFSYNAQGGTELTLSGAGVIRPRGDVVRDSGISSLRLASDCWLVSVDDKMLYDRSDSWMDSNFKRSEGGLSGQDLLKERYTVELNNEVAANILRASTIEKNARLKLLLILAAIDDVAMGLGLGLGYYGVKGGVKSLVEMKDSGISIGEVLNLSSSGVLGYYSGKLSIWSAKLIGSIQKSLSEHDAKISPIEYFLPNPQLGSRLQARKAIAKKGKKLVQLRQE